MTADKDVLTLRINKEMNSKIYELSKLIGVSKNAYILMVLSKEIQKAS